MSVEQTKLPAGSVVAFSEHPRVFCGWDMDEKKMYSPSELTDLGVVMLPNGKIRFISQRFFPHVTPRNLLIRWYTGRNDSNNRMIFEGDILEGRMNNEFGSVTPTFMIAVWDADHGFVTKLKQAITGVKVPVTDVVYIGNEIENPELIKKHFSNE